MNTTDFKKMIQAKHGKKRGNQESNLQQQCVKWFRLQYPKLSKLLFAIPNGARLYGTKKQRIVQWQRLKAEGATPGAADLFLSIPSGDFPGLYIEMKTTSKSSRQSAEQKEFEAAVIGQGYGYAMPRTFDQFRKVIVSYLEKGEY